MHRSTHENKGVTVKSLAAVDLGPQFAGVNSGCELLPLSLAAYSGHKDRPATDYIVEGAIVDPSLCRYFQAVIDLVRLTAARPLAIRTTTIWKTEGPRTRMRALRGPRVRVRPRRTK